MIPILIPYYGTKASIVLKYPAPAHDTIIEPFAGAASYSLYYTHKNVVLIDKYERLIALWQYLIKATSQEILNLPLIKHGQDPQDFTWIAPEARDLIGWWSHPASCSPGKPSTHFKTTEFSNPLNKWSPRCRARVASIVPKIKHWQAIVGDYTDAPDVEATWFVDPPYQVKGVHYKHSAKNIDYDHLATWCKSQKGRVIVCEGQDADWLPFETFSVLHGGANRKSIERIWTSDNSHKIQQIMYEPVE